MPDGVVDAPRLKKTLAVKLFSQTQINLTAFRQILGYVPGDALQTVLSRSNPTNIHNVRVTSNSLPVFRESILRNVITVNHQVLMVRQLNDRHPATDTVALTPQTVKESVPGLSMAFYGDATTLNLPQGQGHEFRRSERFKAPFNEIPIFFTPSLRAAWTLAGETLATSRYQEIRLATIGTIEISLTRA